MLPKIDGIEVCRRLRSRSQVPIIMLTAKDDETDKVLGLEMGADDYITKPFSVREFRSRVRAALRRSEMLRGRSGGEPIVAGEIAIDFERRAVTARGEPATLTYVEFELLASLARAPGKVMTREMLLEQVWGDSAYRDPRTIDVHIRHLREKLERDPRQPRVPVHRGQREWATPVHGDLGVMNSVRNRLALLIFVITAAAVGFIYLYVVPQLRDSLTAEKLRRLEQVATRAGPAARGRDDRRRLAGKHRAAAAQHRPAHRIARDRCSAVREGTSGPEPSFVIADSELERAAVAPSYPAAAAARGGGADRELGRGGRGRAPGRDRAGAVRARRAGAGSRSSPPTSPTSTTTSR